jgi:putative ABC transport system permease protein
VSIGRPRPARRALGRWAWRLFRREWRQQLLVLALITVAVAASVAAAAISANGASTTNGQLGDADALIRVDARDQSAAARAVTAARRRFGDVEVISHQHVALPGVREQLDLRGQDPHGRYGHPTLALRAGRYPTAAGEVALTDGAAARLSARIGDHVALGRVERTVVGEIENPDDLDDEFALVAPGTDSAADSLTLLVDTANRNRALGSGDSGQPQLDVEIFATDRAAVAAVLLVAISLGMVLVGLIATTGFVVVAQRRQRQLGLLAAIGATERDLRFVMVANGAIVGTIAALIGAAVGVAGWIAAAPAVETAAAHRIDRFDLPWTLILVIIALAVGMATAAAWWPARSASRLPVIGALAARPGQPRPVHRSTTLAAGFVVLGAAATSFAQPTSDHVRPLLLVVGVVSVAIGAALAAPTMIRALAAPAAHLPFAARLALRDLVRYQTRAAAALAAVTLATGIAVTAVALAQANVPHADAGNLSDRQLVIDTGDSSVPVPGTAGAAAENTRLDARARTVAESLGGAVLFDLDVAVHPTDNAARRSPISVVRPLGNGFRRVGTAYVATPELLAHFGIAAPVSNGTELLTALTADVMLLDENSPPARGATVDDAAVQRVDLPPYTSAPNSLITDAAMRRHGWVPVRAGWFVETSRPLTAAQIAAARAAAADAGLRIEVRDTSDGLTAVRRIATLVGTLLALAIVTMTIGLIRGESSGDLRTLTATGAAPRTRRAITATTAAALAALGAILGAAGAYVALISAYHDELGSLAPLPVVELATIVVGLPVIAAAAGWGLAGREPKRFARRALD